MSASILLVIEDDEVRLRFERALSEEGWRVIPADTGAQARKMAARRGFQVAVVDNRLPDERGFEVIKSLKGLGVSKVALILKEDTGFRITARELAGVRDSLTFPVNLLELVKYFLSVPAAEPIAIRIRTRHGDLLEIDPGLKRVRKGGREVQLTPTEYGILCTLAERPGHVFSPDELLRSDVYLSEHTVDNHIRYLRGQLGDNSGKRRLIAVRGFGYRLNGYRLNPG